MSCRVLSTLKFGCCCSLELQLLLRGVLAAELTLTISSSSSTCRPNDQVHELSSPLDAKIWLLLLLEPQLLRLSSSCFSVVLSHRDSLVFEAPRRLLHFSTLKQTLDLFLPATLRARVAEKAC